MAICPKCDEDDLSLIGYTEIEPGQYEVEFECRVCRKTFTRTISEAELNYYR